MERGFPFISFAIIVQNEENTITPLLQQLKDFQEQYNNAEIVVVDGGSDDKTLEVVSKYVPKTNVYVKPFTNDFAEQRNFLTSKCKGEWIFHIDADELMSRDLFFKLNDILTSAASNTIDVLFVPRVNIIEKMTLDDKKRFEGIGWQVDKDRHINFPDYQTRIQRKNSLIYWEGKVHEQLTHYERYFYLPKDKKVALIHNKSAERQYKQLNRYSKIQR